jgi:hypothetical protein
MPPRFPFHLAAACAAVIAFSGPARGVVDAQGPKHCRHCSRATTKSLGRGGHVELASLNAFVYSKVFLTPAADPRLGLLPRTDFTGLPGDGVVMR